MGSTILMVFRVFVKTNYSVVGVNLDLESKIMEYRDPFVDHCVMEPYVLLDHYLVVEVEVEALHNHASVKEREKKLWLKMINIFQKIYRVNPSTVLKVSKKKN